MRNRALAAIALFAVAAGSATARQESFTLEQVLRAPFPTDLVAAPSGGRIAWVANAEGIRNIWVAEPPDYRARAVTDYGKDDGQSIGDLCWTPDGERLLFVRGGDVNGRGEHPNPTSHPEGIDQALYAIGLSGGAPRKLAEGRAPAVSPRGDGVAFLREDQIWWAPLDGSAAPKQIVKSRGRSASLTWSPDGRRLAFVSRRDDHAFIGVYDTETRRLRFLDPSVDRDQSPTWSADGTRIAFIRIPASRQLFTFGPHREAEPWSIRIAALETGRGREVWRAAEGKGSVFRGVSAESQLLWTAGDRLVFPWEREGWTHLYSVPVAGGEAILLTPGEHEVEHVTLAPDRASIVFSSNQEDVDRRHLWRVAPSGGPPEPVTRGAGIEWSPVVTSGGEALAFFASDARRPARPAILLGDADPRDLAPEAVPADFPLEKLVEPEPVIFSAADGMKIHGQLFRPRDLGPGERRPAVVFFHGGSRRQMLLGWHYLDYYHKAYALNQYLADVGFVVLSVNYRSGIGYGMEFREAIDYGARGASEFNDVLGAGLYLQNRPDVDPDRIGLWGGSYGGYLTALGLARASHLFGAGVDLHGVHDWNVVIRNFAPTYDPRERQEMARRAFASSPMAFLDTWRSPVLVIHGDDDRNVPFSETVDLVEELRKRDVEVEQLIFPDEVHGFLLHARWLEAYRAAADFLIRRLQPE